MADIERSSDDRHDPLTCEICHAEGTGAEIAALKAEADRWHQAWVSLANSTDAQIERLRGRVADLEDERDGLIDELLRAESEGYVSRAATRMEGDDG